MDVVRERLGEGAIQALEEPRVEIVDYVPYASHSHSIGRCKNMCAAPDLRLMIFDAFRLTGGIGLEGSDGGTYDGHRWGEDNAGGGILCVGGTGAGADCATVVRAGISVDVLSTDFH